MDTEDSPLISMGLPGCPYRMTSYTGTALVDADKTYGLQLHHPRSLEFIGAFWVNRLGEECAMAAADNLQRDAGPDVVGNDEYLCRSSSLSSGGGGEVIHDSKGAAGGQIHDSDGPVAPSVGSGCSRAIAGIILHGMRVLFWQKRATCPVTVV